MNNKEMGHPLEFPNGFHEFLGLVYIFILCGLVRGHRSEEEEDLFVPDLNLQKLVFNSFE